MGNSDKLIMVVDDEPTMCQILERILSGEGYRVVVAMDGEKALKLFKEHHAPPSQTFHIISRLGLRVNPPPGLLACSSDARKKWGRP